MDTEKAHEKLWIDQADALSMITAKRTRGEITECEADELEAFHRDGFVILEQAIAPELVEQICMDMRSAPEHPGKFFGKLRGQSVAASQQVVWEQKFRFIDLHINSLAARKAIFSPRISRFLMHLYQGPVLAFQSLSFNVGSQQQMHQDTAYVVVERPYTLTASWIALEDVVEGSGELQYIPGSHRFPDFLFSGQHKSWVKKRDGVGAHERYVESLYAHARDRHLPVKSFLAKKGDVLIWAADLAHGGSMISNPDATRRSLVTHYCPKGVLPNYGLASPKKYIEVDVFPGCAIASKHYDLSRYDGGTSLEVASPLGETPSGPYG